MKENNLWSEKWQAKFRMKRKDNKDEVRRSEKKVGKN
jgi:hypothetical protein